MNVIKMLSVIVTEIKADTDPSPLFVFRCRGQHVPSQVTRYHRDVSHQSSTPLRTSSQFQQNGEQNVIEKDFLRGRLLTKIYEELST